MAGHKASTCWLLAHFRSFLCLEPKRLQNLLTTLIRVFVPVPDTGTIGHKQTKEPTARAVGSMFAPSHMHSTLPVDGSSQMAASLLN